MLRPSNVISDPASLVTDLLIYSFFLNGSWNKIQGQAKTFYFSNSSMVRTLPSAVSRRTHEPVL